MSKDALTLNDTSLDSSSRLLQLCAGSVGGILVATRLFDETGRVTEPFITILATPAVTTYRTTATDTGLLLDDIWDDCAL
jgi:hypothetical protein